MIQNSRIDDFYDVLNVLFITMIKLKINWMIDDEIGKSTTMKVSF